MSIPIPVSPSSPDDLASKTDAELNEIFAVEVAGMTIVTFPKGACPSVKHWKFPDGRLSMFRDRDFCADANAVLPWLEKFGWHAAHNEVPYAFPYCIRLFSPMPPGIASVNGAAPTFARACVIALIRAKRAR